MIKILTYINTALLGLAVSVGTLAYFQRGKITESIMTEVQKQLPSLVKGAMPKIPSVPKMTGGASLQGIPFK
tara:strand:- start:121 stop:336 length:216 start_codon:yes stop_codon:yes gene_type:complete